MSRWPVPFLAGVADLLLKTETGTRQWLSVPRLRRGWYWTCGILLAVAVLNLFRPAFNDLLRTSSSAMLVFRMSNLFLMTSLQISWILLATRYYEFVLTRKAQIRLDNILVFYVGGTLNFGMMYFLLYSIELQCFAYSDPAIVPGPTAPATQHFWAELQAKRDFILFSAFQSLNAGFYRIQPHCLLASALAYVQSACTLALIGLLISSYVNQKTK